MTAADTSARSAAVEVAVAYLDALGGSDPNAVADLVAVDFVNEHQNALGSGCEGREEYRRRLPGFFAGFPGRRYEIVKLTAGTTGDDGVTDVVARYRFRTDVVVGHGDDRRTEHIDLPGVMWIEVRAGEVIRRVDTWDALSYFHQSGDTPTGFTRTSGQLPNHRPDHSLTSHRSDQP
ncbi:MAG: nuclear transport factor 2 family protein [Actinomycetota bacterium]